MRGTNLLEVRKPRVSKYLRWCVDGTIPQGLGDQKSADPWDGVDIVLASLRLEDQEQASTWDGTNLVLAF